MFFSKFSKFDVAMTNAAKNWQKTFCFLDNCISIGCNKLSLTVNALANSPRLSDITKRVILNSISQRVLKKYDKSAVARISAVFGNL